MIAEADFCLLCGSGPGADYIGLSNISFNSKSI